MATVDINLAAQRLPANSTRVVIRAGEDSFMCDWTDPKVTHGGVGAKWSEIDRPGHTPVLAYAGQKLRTMSTKVVFDQYGWPGATDAIESALVNLQFMARLNRVMTVQYGLLEYGPWVLDSLDIDSELRHPGTNQIARATATLNFKESKLPPTPKPVVQAPPPPPPPPPAPPPAPEGRIYVVVKGDTLWDISKRFYNNPLRWTQIADANGVKDPKKLQIGTRLRIP